MTSKKQLCHKYNKPRAGVENIHPCVAPDADEAASVLAVLRERKTTAFADYLELKNEIADGTLTHRELVSHVFARVFTGWTSILFPMGQSKAPTIAAIIATTREVSQIDIQAMIEKYAYEAASNIREKMIDLIDRA